MRGQLGLTALFVGNDHGDLIDDSRDGCRNTPGAACDTNEGPFFGPHVGLGFGLLVDAGSVAFRAELLGQAVRYPFWRSKTTSGGTTLELKNDVVGTRSMILLGLEL